MAWITQLCTTYDNLEKRPKLLQRCQSPLVPLSHTLQTAHVEITLDENGKLLTADGIPAEKALTLVPCTEDSAVRSSGIAPHALYDNLKYIAGDAWAYCNNEKLRENYTEYIKNLEAWRNDECCTVEVKAVYEYLKKGTLINDLLEKGILFYEDGALTKKWGGDAGNKPAGEMLSVFVRFKVRSADGDCVECNENTRLMRAYAEFDAKRYTNKRLCFISGTEMPVTYKHPSKIRYSGDSARLISANDTSGFTFRGRFHNSEDAVAVGYEVSQKAHSALRWLIANQGFKIGDQTVIVWSAEAAETVSPMIDSFDLFANPEPIDNYTPSDAYAKQVELAINGYRHADLDTAADISIMIIEAATPGRMSIKYYREFTNSKYFDNIENWHKTCIWNHDYKIINQTIDQEDGSKKEERKHIKFTGAPSVGDIIFASYGANVDDKLKKQLYEILIACIAENKKLPKDVMMKAVMRASNPSGMENWEINKTTSIACALVKKYYEKGNYDMALDYENRDRSYLFGRVLAYAEQIEDYAMYKAGEKRVPNARKLRSKFRIQPAKTLMILDEKLEPYVEKLYVSHNRLYQQMQEVISLIDAQDYMNNRPLEPTYLLGYACQIAALRTKNSEAENNETDNNETEVF
jgi:CRISPR-associated protein Csd1